MKGKVRTLKKLNKLLALLLSLIMALSMAVPAFASEKTEAEEGNASTEAGKIVILHTNDVHCNIDQAKSDEGAVTNIGYAGLAAYKAEAEAKYGADNVTLIDAGDAIQGNLIGNLTDGEYIVEIMNKVGYDLAVPGNHEFDFQVPNFLGLAKDTAEFDYLCCNFVDLTAKKPAFDSYKIVEYGETKVGYVGISTPETFTSSTPTYFQDEDGNYIYSFSEGSDGKPLYEAVQTAVDAARKDGADYVVAVAHLGIETPDSPYSSTSVIANTTGIDALIDGHSHSVVPGDKKPNKDGKDVIVNQTGTQLANIGQIVIDAATGEISAGLVSGYEKQDEDVAAYIQTMKDEFDEMLSEVIGKTEAAFSGAVADGETPRLVRTQETNTGDLVADAFREVLEADVAFMNGGGIRADVAVGNVTYSDIVSVLPFTNTACTMEVTGQTILDALEWSAKDAPKENGGFLQVSGISYTIDTAVASTVAQDDHGVFTGVSGERRVKDVKVGGEAIDPAKTYVLAGHNYMLKNCGDGFGMFSGCKLLKDEVMMQSQVLITYIKENLEGTIPASYAEPAGRVTVVEEAVSEPEPEPAEPAPAEPAPAEPAPEDKPEPEPAPAPAPAETGSYTVAGGDCLWKIAQSQYGDGSLWTLIYEANRDTISNPDQIWIGQVLVIPAA